MSKFQRRYVLTVQGRSGAVHNLSYPLTCIFEINKRSEGGLNSAHFMVYNLSAATRSDIEFDNAIDINPKNSGGVINRTLQFSAGYASEGNLPILFQGNIKKAFYYRDGPDVVTDIDVMDGLDAVQKAQIQGSAAYPWNAKAEAATIVQTMNQYGVRLGAIGSLFDGAQNTRGVMWLGSSWNVLKKLAKSHGGRAYIDDQKVYLMSPNDALASPADVPQIDASTGLIGTPRRYGWRVDAEMLFEPSARLGQTIRVASSVNRSINGTFSVQTVGHRGIISGAKDGGVVTALSLFGPPNPFVMVPPL